MQSRAKIGRELKDLCWLELQRSSGREMRLQRERGMCGGKLERRYGSLVVAQALVTFMYQAFLSANTV